MIMANRKIGQNGLNLIKEFEGCRLKAYKCSAGVYTIGYGHTAGVKAGMTITQEQAEEYLKQDCQKFANYVNKKYYVPRTAELNQNQFDALVSFAFNCGQGNLFKLCAGRTLAQIAVKMISFNKTKGKVLPGLTRRRQVEQKLFNTKVEEEFKTGLWYKVLTSIPVRNGYYGDVGKYKYLSDKMKQPCENKDGYGYLKAGAVVFPEEVKQFADGSTWFMLDGTIACMVVEKDGTSLVEKA